MAYQEFMDVELLSRMVQKLEGKLRREYIQLRIFDHKEIVFGDVIGEGGVGIVHKCTVRPEGEATFKAAAKVIKENSEYVLEKVMSEVELMHLAGPSTVKVFGVTIQPDAENRDVGQLVILMEAGLKNCLELFKDVPVKMDVTLSLCSQIAKGVESLHKKNILHHDLKPDNILITEIDSGEKGIEDIEAKVIDFGLGRLLDGERVEEDCAYGTYGYHAPEILNSQGYDLRADIFSLGITFAVLLCSPDFLKTNLHDLLWNMHEGKLEGKYGEELYKILADNILPTLPVAVKNMICSMLECEEKKRISLGEIAYICRREAYTARQAQRDAETPRSPERPTHRPTYRRGTQRRTQPSTQRSTHHDPVTLTQHGTSTETPRSPQRPTHRPTYRRGTQRDPASVTQHNTPAQTPRPTAPPPHSEEDTPVARRTRAASRQATKRPGSNDDSNEPTKRFRPER